TARLWLGGGLDVLDRGVAKGSRSSILLTPSKESKCRQRGIPCGEQRELSLYSSGESTMRTKGEVEITKRAVEAFVALQSQRTGLRSEVHPWPGGDERGHDADALVIFREGAGFLRVLVEATRCLQGPIEPYGSG